MTRLRLLSLSTERNSEALPLQPIVDYCESKASLGLRKYLSQCGLFVCSDGSGRATSTWEHLRQNAGGTVPEVLPRTPCFCAAKPKFRVPPHNGGRQVECQIRGQRFFLL
jgi:hypothetical protein